MYDIDRMSCIVLYTVLCSILCTVCIQNIYTGHDLQAGSLGDATCAPNSWHAPCTYKHEPGMRGDFKHFMPKM